MCTDFKQFNRYVFTNFRQLSLTLSPILKEQAHTQVDHVVVTEHCSHRYSRTLMQTHCGHRRRCRRAKRADSSASRTHGSLSARQAGESASASTASRTRGSWSAWRTGGCRSDGHGLVRSPSSWPRCSSRRFVVPSKAQQYTWAPRMSCRPQTQAVRW